MREYSNGTLEEILHTHGTNMANAARCKARHAAIVQAIEELRASTESQQ
jgi:hypothetical protein